MLYGIQVRKEEFNDQILTKGSVGYSVDKPRGLVILLFDSKTTRDNAYWSIATKCSTAEMIVQPLQEAEENTYAR